MSLNLQIIQEAQPRVHQYIKPTPLIRSSVLEKELNFPGKIFFKCEQENPTGSF